jgi:hypothetical protein
MTLVSRRNLTAPRRAAAHADVRWSGRIGGRTLNNLLLGRYHRPVREERAFMAVDIKGATALAERLGDERAHAFITCLRCLEAIEVALARRSEPPLRRGNHAASLNLGDCFAYALARATSERLLFKGEDFAKTDIPSAL